jgi:hypothetical protein
VSTSYRPPRGNSVATRARIHKSSFVGSPAAPNCVGMPRFLGFEKEGSDVLLFTEQAVLCMQPCGLRVSDSVLLDFSYKGSRSLQEKVESKPPSTLDSTLG